MVLIKSAKNVMIPEKTSGVISMTKRSRKHASLRKTPWDLSEELTPMQSFIRSTYFGNYTEKHPALLATDEAELLNSFEVSNCKYCQSTFIRKYGYTKNGVQRYQCRECGRSFTITANSLFADHKVSISEWIEYCINLLSFTSTNSTSRNNKNSFTTSKYWLKKLFIALETYQNGIILQGRVELDETFYRVEQKHQRLQDGKALRGLSSNQICIGIACDATNTYCIVEGGGKPSADRTLAAFQAHIEPGATLVHDMEKSHNALIRNLQLVSEAYASAQLKNMPDNNNPLRHVNHRCFLLKAFLNAHTGFDRNDMQNYLNLFTFSMNPPDNVLEKVERLLTFAFNIDRTLRFCDAF